MNSTHILTTTPAAAAKARTVWIDLDNSPHVPFFLPIIEELEKRRYRLLITARNAYQVCELLDFYKLPARVIGRHYGKNKVLKVAGVCLRAAQLAAQVAWERPDLAVSHGSRSQLLASFMLGIPNLTIVDYEFASKTGFVRPTWVMVPEVIPTESAGFRNSQVLKYPGIKEDVYLSRFKPTPLRESLGVSADDLLVMFRPPATEAHYHNPESELLLAEALNYLSETPGVTTVLLPRNERQAAEMHQAWAAQLASRKLIIPARVEDGLNLIWNSDLVISGGGTMNREAAAMGVPVYSIFRGRIGAVDHYLEREGRLVLLETATDVRRKLKLVRRPRNTRPIQSGASPALRAMVENIISMTEFRAPAALGEITP